MNRSKLILPLIAAILLLAAAVFFWNPGNNNLEPGDVEGGNSAQAEEGLDPANPDSADPTGNAAGGRLASPEASTAKGLIGRAVAIGGSYEIRALAAQGSAAPNARFLLENINGEIEWISAPGGVIKLPDFSKIRHVAALANSMWSEPLAIGGVSGKTVDLELTLAAANIELQVNRQGKGAEAEFEAYYRFRDKPANLGETLAAVFQAGETERAPDEPASSNLFYRAFRVTDDKDPRSKGRDGKLMLKDLPPGFYSLQAQSTWGVQQSETVELKAGAYEVVTFELATGGWLTGRVLGPDGAPLSGATVMYRASENSLVDALSQRRVRQVLANSYGAEPRSDLAHSDDNGEFSMGPVAAGPGILAAGKEGLLPVIVDNLVIDGGQSQTVDDIKLQSGHAVALLVTDAASGEVLTHAVAAWQGAGDTGLLSTAGWEIGEPDDRDPQGRVILRNLPFEKLNVRVQAEGYARREMDYLMPAESWQPKGELPTLEVALQPGLKLTGAVLDAITGEPVAKAQVAALDEDNQGALSGIMQRIGTAEFPTTESKEDGSFEFADLPAGDYVLQAQHSDYAPVRSETIALETGFAPHTQLLLRPGATLIAHYIGSDGNSEANRSIILVHLELGSTQTQITNEEGMAHFEGLPAGNMQIATLPGDANPEEVGQGNLDLDFVFVELSEGETRIVELGPGLSQCTLEGTVTRGGAPVADKSVTLLGTAGLKSGNTGENGEFSFDGLRAGEYSYIVGVQNAPAFTGTVTIATGTNSVAIQLPDGGIKATLLKASDRSPVVGETVTVTANNTRGGPLFAMSNGKGEVEFPDLEPGVYQVNAGKASLPMFGGDSELGSKIIDVQVGQSIEEIEILLEAGATFRARVLGTDGTPVSGASLYYLRSDGMPLSPISVKATNSKGVAQLTGLPSGPGRIAVRHLEHGQAEIAVNLTAGELSKQEIQLQTGALVYIQVTDGSDQNLPGILATLEDSRGARTSWLFSMAESSEYNRAYFSGSEQRLGPMSPGDYTLKLFRLGGKVVEYKMTIPPDTPELRVRYAYNP